MTEQQIPYANITVGYSHCYNDCLLIIAVQTNGQSVLTGWELVEDHFVKHDTNVVEGFNKDIDTLLVFVCISYRSRTDYDLMTSSRPVCSLPCSRRSSSSH